MQEGWCQETHKWRVEPTVRRWDVVREDGRECGIPCFETDGGACGLEYGWGAVLASTGSN